MSQISQEANPTAFEAFIEQASIPIQPIQAVNLAADHTNNTELLRYLGLNPQAVAEVADGMVYLPVSGIADILNMATTSSNGEEDMEYLLDAIYHGSLPQFLTVYPSVDEAFGAAYDESISHEIRVGAMDALTAYTGLAFLMALVQRKGIVIPDTVEVWGAVRRGLASLGLCDAKTGVVHESKVLDIEAWRERVMLDSPTMVLTAQVKR